MNGIQEAEAEERRILESAAIGLGHDRKDVPLTNNADLAAFIRREQAKVRSKVDVSDATQPIVDRFAGDVQNTKKATDAFNALVKDGFTREEAMTILAEQEG